MTQRSVVKTAHISEITGKYSELAARLALLANGWTVHQAETSEAYDILAKDPVSGDYAKIQCKTVRQRFDRGGDLVIYATKGNGTTYDRSEADYIVGVWAAEGELPRVFMTENRLLREYWCAEARASERWIELPLALNRDIYTEAASESPAAA